MPNILYADAITFSKSQKGILQNPGQTNRRLKPNPVTQPAFFSPTLGKTILKKISDECVLFDDIITFSKNILLLRNC